MTTNRLAEAIKQRTTPKETIPFTTRPLSGQSRPPVILIGGSWKVGKSWAIVSASADPRVARTTMIEIGKDAGAADQYGAIPGANVELVEHDNTWDSVTAVIQAAAHRPPVEGGYNVLAIDGATSLWTLLARTAQSAGRELGPAGWATVNAMWDDLLSVLREHPGPVVMTARMESGDIVDETLGKVRTQKDLAYDVDYVVQAIDHRDFVLTGARSLALADLNVGGTVPLGDLNLPDLLDMLSGTSSSAA